MPRSTLWLVNALIAVAILGGGGFAYRQWFPSSPPAPTPTPSNLAAQFKSLPMDAAQRQYFTNLFNSLARIIEADTQVVATNEQHAKVITNAGLLTPDIQGLGKLVGQHFEANLSSQPGDFTPELRAKATVVWKELAEACRASE